LRAISTDLRRSRSIAAEVRAGLSARPKTLSPKLFYDARGSELFEQITGLPEYYLTRTETCILQKHAREMVLAAGLPPSIVELGAGTATKTRLILSALQALRGSVQFFPVDVSEAALEAAQENLRGLRRVRVTPLVADYTAGMDFVAQVPAPRMVLYLGSSIGNFEPMQSSLLLAHLRSRLSKGDTLLLGTDLVKSKSILIPAYDDAQGVTAEFNANALERINRELGADFDVDSFAHEVRWNRQASRIEMHLRSTRAQTVEIPALRMIVKFEENETIHTENSYKFTETMVDSILTNGGFIREHTWYDPLRYFALHMARLGS